MHFYYKFILKYFKNFQDFTDKEKKIHLMLCKHIYICFLLDAFFMNTILPNIFVIFLCVINIVMAITTKCVVTHIFIFIIRAIIITILSVESLILYKKQTKDDVSE